jgi:flagellar biosynthesis chaperone FliJ
MLDLKPLLKLNILRRRSVDVGLLRINSEIRNCERKLAGLSRRREEAEANVYRSNLERGQAQMFRNLNIFLVQIESQEGKLCVEIRALRAEKIRLEETLKAVMATDDYLQSQISKTKKAEARDRDMAESNQLQQLNIMRQMY